jgi:hypothetical protein
MIPTNNNDVNTSNNTRVVDVDSIEILQKASNGNNIDAPILKTKSSLKEINNSETTTVITTTKCEKDKQISSTETKPTLISEQTSQSVSDNNNKETNFFDLIKELFTTSPKLTFGMYLLILFTWIIIEKSSILILIIGCGIGYIISINSLKINVKTLEQKNNSLIYNKNIRQLSLTVTI